LRLPVHVAAAAADDTVAADGPVSAKGNAADAGPRRRPAQTIPSRPLEVLLVEDNPINRRLTQVLLEKEGHRVKLARSGPEAVAIAATSPPDMILMDVQMPGMDGIDATGVIRS